MAQIAVDIPDAALPRVRDAFAVVYGYQAILTNEDGSTTPNPESKTQFAKRQVALFVKNVLKQHEASVAEETARLAALVVAESVVIA